MTTSDFGRRYFSKKPHKSLYFWLPTVWLVVVAGMPLVLAEQFYSRPDFGGVGGGLLWMCLSVGSLFILWIRAWRCHSKLHQLTLESQGFHETDRERLGAALTQAAYLEYAGLLAALLAVQTAFVGVAKLLGK